MSDNSEEINVRVFGEKKTTLEELIEENLGLYIPLNQLSATDLEKLRAFLNEIEHEPIALAHSNATDN